MTPGLGSYLIVSGALFAIGLAGVLLRRSPLVVLLSLEVMLNSANLALVGVRPLRRRAATARCSRWS